MICRCYGILLPMLSGGDAQRDFGQYAEPDFLISTGLDRLLAQPYDSPLLSAYAL